MERTTFQMIESYMLQFMGDSAHDREHVYRVLYTALQIARQEANVDMDVLICACLLHDIGRQDQFADPQVCHAEAGSKRAYTFLRQQGFSEDFAAHVRDCIVTHRFRKNRQPESLEAKILFDADKLDVTGALGIARTLMYAGTVSAPLYTRNPEGKVSDGEQDTEPSFFREYHFKLKKLYDRFYTKTGRLMAAGRRKAAEDFYHCLYTEVQGTFEKGQSALEAVMGKEWTDGSV